MPSPGRAGGWPLAELVLPWHPITQLCRWRPLDLHYFNKTVPASTLQISCFSARHCDWLKKFLSIPRKQKSKHSVSHRYPSSASEVQPVWKLNHGFNFSVVSNSQVHIRQLHTQLQLPVKKSFILQKYHQQLQSLLLSKV